MTTQKLTIVPATPWDCQERDAIASDLGPFYVESITYEGDEEMTTQGDATHRVTVLAYDYPSVQYLRDSGYTVEKVDELKPQVREQRFVVTFTDTRHLGMFDVEDIENAIVETYHGMGWNHGLDIEVKKTFDSADGDSWDTTEQWLADFPYDARWAD